MRISVPYSFGDVVYLKMDEEQVPHEIIAVIVRPGPSVLLELSSGGDEDITVYDFQISTEKDELKVLISSAKNDKD